MKADILIKNAKTRFEKEGLVDIAIKDGRILSIEATSGPDAQQIIDAQGNLVTESYVNGHLHLCKVYTLKKVGEEASEVIIASKNNQADEIIYEMADLWFHSLVGISPPPFPSSPPLQPIYGVLSLSRVSEARG